METDMYFRCPGRLQVYENIEAIRISAANSRRLEFSPIGIIRLTERIVVNAAGQI